MAQKSSGTTKYKDVNEWQAQEIKKGNKEADAGHLINHEDVLKKAIDSFGSWEEREESSVEIVNKIRADKRGYAKHR